MQKTTNGLLYMDNTFTALVVFSWFAAAYKTNDKFVVFCIRCCLAGKCLGELLAAHFFERINFVGRDKDRSLGAILIHGKRLLALFFTQLFQSP